MNEKMVDLHVHSTESDGTFTPAELVAEAVRAGLAAFALTDHDTCAGVKEAGEAAASAGIELIHGIELSTDYHGKEVHVVGLAVDAGNAALLQKTADFKKSRDARNALMVEALQKEGLPITTEALYKENADCVVTRANIARFLFEHGCVKSVKEAFDRYLGDHCKCYVRRPLPPSDSAVRLIKQAGGAAVLAHPVLYGMGTDALQTLIGELKEAGLDGMEVLYSTYTAGDTEQMRRIAEKNDLLLSGGSDFHGANKPSIRLGTGRGNLRVPYSVWERLKTRTDCLRV